MEKMQNTNKGIIEQNTYNQSNRCRLLQAPYSFYPDKLKMCFPKSAGIDALYITVELILKINGLPLTFSIASSQWAVKELHSFILKMIKTTELMN